MCAPSVSEESDRAAYESVGGGGLRCVLNWATATETSLYVCAYVQSAGGRRTGKLAHFLSRH